MVNSEIKSAICAMAFETVSVEKLLVLTHSGTNILVYRLDRTLLLNS